MNLENMFPYQRMSLVLIPNRCRVPTLPGKREKSGNSVYTFHGREKSLNFIEIAKIRGKIGNFIAGQGSFVVPNLFGY